ncbi:TPA: hypothetical protein DCE37_17380 [Candidatus Latescibacteria bacterium]|nr:hypothetical protein [Candidatus Latescibacterota bacterium]
MPRVLIDDDDKAQLLLIQDALGGESMEIAAVKDARETFEAIYRHIPDLITLDIDSKSQTLDLGTLEYLEKPPSAKRARRPSPGHPLVQAQAVPDLRRV